MRRSSVAAGLLLLFLFACTVTTPPTASVTASPPVHPGWVTYDLPAEGLSLQTPPDWHLVQEPLPTLNEPHALFATGTYFFPAKTDANCDFTMYPALEKLPEGGMLFWLEEWRSPGNGDFPTRSDPIRLANLGDRYACIPAAAYDTPFQDQGRYFQVFVAFGPNAPEGLRSAVIDSLTSLAIDPSGAPGPGPDAASSRISPPTFRPVAEWNTLATSEDPSVLAPGAEPAVSWAANVPFAPADLDQVRGGVLTGAGNTWPNVTIRGLSSEDVVLVADLPVPGFTPPVDGANFAATRLPLDVRDAQGPVEGSASQWLLTANVNGQYVDVRFFFGTADPSSSQWQTAQDELNRLQVPSLPPGV